MAKVAVSINGRVFELACEEGQERQLRELARFFDRHVRDLHTKFGNVGEARLFIMAGLMIADQLSEALAQIEEIEQDVTSLHKESDEVHGDAERLEETAISDIEGLAERIEGLTRSLQG